MTLDKIKKIVRESLGISHLFRFRGARNQIEEFEGVITDLYPSIFIVTTNNNVVRSFTYSDLLIANLEIVD